MPQFYQGATPPSILKNPVQIQPGVWADGDQLKTAMTWGRTGAANQNRYLNAYRDWAGQQNTNALRNQTTTTGATGTTGFFGGGSTGGTSGVYNGASGPGPIDAAGQAGYNNMTSYTAAQNPNRTARPASGMIWGSGTRGVSNEPINPAKANAAPQLSSKMPALTPKGSTGATEQPTARTSPVAPNWTNPTIGGSYGVDPNVQRERDITDYNYGRWEGQYMPYATGQTKAISDAQLANYASPMMDDAAKKAQASMAAARQMQGASGAGPMSGGGGASNGDFQRALQEVLAAQTQNYTAAKQYQQQQNQQQQNLAMQALANKWQTEMVDRMQRQFQNSALAAGANAGLLNTNLVAGLGMGGVTNTGAPQTALIYQQPYGDVNSYQTSWGGGKKMNSNPNEYRSYLGVG